MTKISIPKTNGVGAQGTVPPAGKHAVTIHDIEALAGGGFLTAYLMNAEGRDWYPEQEMSEAEMINLGLLLGFSGEVDTDEMIGKRLTIRINTSGEWLPPLKKGGRRQYSGRSEYRVDRLLPAA